MKFCFERLSKEDLMVQFISTIEHGTSTKMDLELCLRNFGPVMCHSSRTSLKRIVLFFCSKCNGTANKIKSSVVQDVH